MATKAHSLVSVAARHPIPKYEYANAGARTGATGFTSNDLNAVAHQQDNDTYWILTVTTPTWIQIATAPAAGFTAASVLYADALGGITDDGANFSYAAGVVTLSSGVTFTAGGTIATTANGDINLVPDGTGILMNGTGAPGSLGTPVSGDFYNQGRFECDGWVYIDSGINIVGNCTWTSSAAKFNDNVELRFGSGNDTTLSYVVAQTPDTLMIGTGTDANSVILCEKDDRGYDFQHTLQVNPTIFGQSANRSATEWWSLTHDQTDFLISSGTLTTKFASGLKYNRTTVNAGTYDLLASDYIVHVTYTVTGAVTSLTLPSAQTVDGRKIEIKDAGGNASVNNITIDTQGAETIDGAATAVMNADYEWIKMYSDGTNWFINGG